jgi:hypothetical protein
MGDGKKSSIVSLTEASTDIYAHLSKLAPVVSRISLSGTVRCDAKDIEVMLACVRYVAICQATDRELGRLNR